ncbi:hypothetical protein ACRAWG_36310 [Methylobacterium sp. P31]
MRRRARPLRSLQAQLALRLAGVILLATALGVGVLLYKGMDAADAPGNEQLQRRAAEIARHVAPGPDGTPRAELPPEPRSSLQVPAPDGNVRRANG